MRLKPILKSILFLLLLMGCFSNANFSETSKLKKKTLTNKSANNTNVKIDENLEISFPKSNQGQANRFIFKPYPQEFIQKSLKLLHVILKDISPILLELEYIGNEKAKFFQNLDTTVFLSHYIFLLEFHPVFQIRKSSLSYIDDLKERFENDLLREINLDPENKLKELKARILEYPFEDVYGLNNLYQKIQSYIQPAILKDQSDYDWFIIKNNEFSEPNYKETYFSFLDQNSLYILQGMLESFHKLLVNNIEESLPYISKTYLNYNQKLFKALKLLDPPETTIKRIELALEFANLRFEPYESAPLVYQELARLYPQFEGAADYYINDQTKSKLFFPFFDQMMNQAELLKERGKEACYLANSPDAKICKSLWSNAITIYSFILDWAPYRILSKEALDALNFMLEKNRTGVELISKPALMKLMDKTNKPYL